MLNRDNSGNGGSFLNTFWALLLFVLVLAGTFIMARMVFRLLYFIGPVILVAALILDYKVFLEYIGWMKKILKRDRLLGIVAIVLSLIGYPIVSALLLARVLLRRQVKTIRQEQERRTQGELADFEELESRQLTKLPPQFREAEDGGDILDDSGKS